MLQSLICLAVVAIFAALCRAALGEVEANGWGGMRGIRVKGELMEIATTLRLVSPNGPNGQAETAQISAYHVTNPRFTRQGGRQLFSGTIAFCDATQSMTFRQAIGEGPEGAAIDISATANADLALEGVYFQIYVPLADYSNGSVQLISADDVQKIGLGRLGENGAVLTGFVRGTAKTILLAGETRRLEVSLSQAAEVMVESGVARGTNMLALSFPLAKGNVARGASVRFAASIKASGTVDSSPAKLRLDASRPGLPFAGIGGNFRIQTPADAAFIQYNLDHLRLAWGRVSMPLDLWQATEEADPSEAAPADLPREVREAMEMAHLLAQRNISIIASVWQLPDWATQARDSGEGGMPQARRVHPAKRDAVVRCIASYLRYMEKHFGAQTALFSFNESDIGIHVFQTPREHTEMIRLLGAYFAAKKMTTKLLLGDTSNAYRIDFIRDAMRDPEALKYVAAVGFHSWHGGSREVFAGWGDAARQLKVPLLCSEGGIDSDAWHYPAIFEEPWFSLDEIDVYVRMCAAAQPASIMQWQLTENYSVLLGGEGSGDAAEPLRPATRFHQLAQLNQIPPTAKWLPIVSDKRAVSACAYGDSGSGKYIIHMVNNGASRPVTIAGIPDFIEELQQTITSTQPGVGTHRGSPIAVHSGCAVLTLEPMTFVSVSVGIVE